MSKTAIRREAGKKDMVVTAGDYEGEYAKAHPDVSYHCQCVLNGRTCMAKMRHVSKTIAKYPHKVVERSAYFASYNEQTKHLPGCPNSQDTPEIVRILTESPDRIIMEDFMRNIINGRPAPPRPGGGEGPEPKPEEPPKTEVEEKGDEMYVFRNARTIRELYQVLRGLDSDTVLGDGKICGNVLVNSRNYLDVRNGELILNDYAVVVAEKCLNPTVRKEYKEGDRGNNIFVLQDPFITKNHKRVFFVLEFPDEFVNYPEGAKKQLIDRLVKGEGIWLVYGKWQLWKTGVYTVYHAKIRHPNQIAKLRNPEEMEEHLRITDGVEK